MSNAPTVHHALSCGPDTHEPTSDRVVAVVAARAQNDHQCLRAARDVAVDACLVTKRSFTRDDNQDGHFHRRLDELNSLSPAHIETRLVADCWSFRHFSITIPFASTTKTALVTGAHET